MPERKTNPKRPTIPMRIQRKIDAQAKREGVQPRYIFLKWLEVGEAHFAKNSPSTAR